MSAIITGYGGYELPSKFIVNPEQGHIVVYGIVDPLKEDQFFYIGKSNNPRKRLEEHIKSHPYLLSLSRHEQDYTIKLVILSKAMIDDFNPLDENYWILKSLEQGHRLHNRTFPTLMTEPMLKWLEQICHQHGWTNIKTVNGKVHYLPEYGVDNG